MTRLQQRGRAVFLAILLSTAMLAIASGCGTGTTDDGGEPPISTKLDVHEFNFDTATREYEVLGEFIPEDDVQRDLVGSLCSKCHPDLVDEVKDSVHYKLAAGTDRIMFPGGGAHGMLDRACGLPSTTGLTNSISDVNLGECARCHINRYLPIMEPMFAGMFEQMGFADPQGQATQLMNAGIDCLICHAHDYKAHPTDGTLAAVAGTARPDAASPTPTGAARDSRDNADFNRDGTPDLVLDTDGDGVMDAPLMMDTDGDGTPDTPWPTVAQDRSVGCMQTIGAPTDHACLRCHEHARTGYKRGTLFAEGHDVHATLDTGVFEGTENHCTVCHTASHHKFVRGHMVGGDLGAADYPPPPPGVPADPMDPTDLTCTSCHDVADLPPGIHMANHLAVISCETCHIPYGSGITYSLFGHGGQVSFARTADGRDTKLVVADMYIAEGKADIDADFEAYATPPMLTWFNGGTSFLAQSLAVKGSPNAKITPFKPMANGMAFDARYFDGATVNNAGDVPYNAYSMFRFFAEGNNAEAFYALGMLDMLPDEVRNVTLADFQSPNPDAQTMALMQIFPNLVYFDKAFYGYEHYLAASGSPYDANGDGIIDAGADFLFDMFGAANAGLQQFAGFNAPMGFPPEYQWYPPYENVSDVISMKLPDGSLMKMFLQMQAAQVPEGPQRDAYLAAVANYPSFSQITLGGHGVVPKTQALGAGGCADCHGPSGVLARTMPVGQKMPVDMGPDMGILEMPIYRWRYYQVQELVDLGLSVTSEEIIAGTANVDIDGNPTYVRESDTTFVLNWFAANDPTGYRPATDATALAGTGLTEDDVSWNGGTWMPVLEPVCDLVPNWVILGLDPSVIWASGKVK